MIRHDNFLDIYRQIPDMVSIHLRPSEVDTREVPGHWEGDLIKGKDNGSAVGTLVELSSGYLLLAKIGSFQPSYPSAAVKQRLY